MKRLLFLILALMMGCGGSNDTTPSTDGQDTTVVRQAYKTHILLHQHLSNVSQSVLSYYDYVEVGHSGWDELEPQYMSKAFLYIDIWASSTYFIDPKDLADGYWQPGPGNLAQPEYRMYFTPDRFAYCYQWNDAHVADFSTWVENAMVNGAMGIFADNWAADRFWWVGMRGEEYWDEDARIAEMIWPGYPSNGQLYTWVKIAEKNATLSILSHREDGFLVCNGPGSVLQNSVHFHEFVGHGKEGWQNLVGTVAGSGGDRVPYDRYRNLDDGRTHWLQINELSPDGTIDSLGVDILLRAVEEAKKRPGKISIGLTYRSSPEWGGSIYQLPTNSIYLDPRNWPGYYDTTGVKTNADLAVPRLQR